jgi:Heterokaryon incompatibility protein (HET)
VYFNNSDRRDCSLDGVAKNLEPELNKEFDKYKQPAQPNIFQFQQHFHVSSHNAIKGTKVASTRAKNFTRINYTDQREACCRTLQHPPIPAEGWIRLLKVCPAQELGGRAGFTADLEREILEVALDDSPNYEALSYAWGSPERNIPILVRVSSLDSEADGTASQRALFITDHLVTALKRLRPRTGCRLIWIDQICINQEDTWRRTSRSSSWSTSTRRRIGRWYG